MARFPVARSDKAAARSLRIFAFCSPVAILRKILVHVKAQGKQDAALREALALFSSWTRAFAPVLYFAESHAKRGKHGHRTRKKSFIPGTSQIRQRRRRAPAPQRTPGRFLPPILEIRLRRRRDRPHHRARPGAPGSFLGESVRRALQPDTRFGL